MGFFGENGEEKTVSQRRIKKPKDERGNHIPAVLALREGRPILRQAGVHHIRCLHDDWCDLLNGRGVCNCNPDVSYVATEGQN